MGDNCFESDGGGRNIRVFENRCFNSAHQALSVQPMFGGPVYFVRNLVYNQPMTSLKYIEGSSGILTLNNTIIGEGKAGPSSNETYRNNLFLAQGSAEPVLSVDTFTPYSSADYNGYRPNPGGRGAPFEGVRHAGVGTVAVVVGGAVGREGVDRQHRFGRALRQEQVVAIGLVGRGAGLALADDGVVQRQDARGALDVLQRGHRLVVDQVAHEIDRPAEHGLHAQRLVGRVEAAVLEDADVASAAVALEAVVAHVGDVVAVEVDRLRETVGDVVRRAVRHAIGRHVDAVVPVGDEVVRHHMALAVDLHRVFGGQHLGIVGEPAPQGARPAHHVVRVVTAVEHIVGDVEVLGVGPVVLHHAADVDHLGVLEREAGGAGDVLDPQEERHLGVPDRDPLDVVVVRAHQVEEILGPVAVEDDLAVACALDHDRLVGRAALGEVVGPVEIVAERQIALVRLLVQVMAPVPDIEPGVDQDHVAGLHPGREGVLIVEVGRAHVVGRHQAGEGGLLLRALPVDRIDVEHAAALGGLGLLPCADDDRLHPLARDAVGIGEGEAALVVGVGFEVEDRAGEQVAHAVLEQGEAALAVRAAGAGRQADHLVLRPHQRHAGLPGGLALLAVGDLDPGVAVVVAGDAPVETERDQGRPLDVEGAGRHGVLGESRRSRRRQQGQHRRPRAQFHDVSPVLSSGRDYSACASGQAGDVRRRRPGGPGGPSRRAGRWGPCRTAG